MTKTAFRQWIGLSAVAASLDKLVHAGSTKRLRRDLAGGRAKDAKLQPGAETSNGHGPSYQQWADEGAQSMPLSSLSFSTAEITLPEFSWHGLDESISMSVPDVDLSMTGEDVHIWDVFVTDEGTADLTSKPTLGPTLINVYVEELVTTIPTISSTNVEEVLMITSSPSKSPSDTNSTESTKQYALVQFEMQTMTRVMNDYEVFGIFQPTCIQFLTRELKYEEHQISNIDCKVTNQQLLGQIGSTVRRLEDISSLVVDINVTGDAASDVQLEDTVNDAFFEKSELFVNALKVKGEKAEIDTFNELYSVTSVEQTNEKSAISTGSGTTEENGPKTGSLIVIITGVGLIVVLIAGFAISRSNPATVRGIEELSLESAGPPQDIVASPKNEVGAFNFDIGYLNTICQEPNKTSYLPNSLTPSQVVPKVRREVLAPRGKLGIVTEDSELGVIIHSVKDESPLEGLLFPGDLIEALDSMDISHLSSSSLTKLMVSKGNYERKITVLSERLHTTYSD